MGGLSLGVKRWVVHPVGNCMHCEKEMMVLGLGGLGCWIAEWAAVGVTGLWVVPLERQGFWVMTTDLLGRRIHGLVAS